MNGDRYEDIPAAPFPVRMVEAGGSGLRLAAARNAAAATASGDVLVFLDLDCIPGAGLCADYAEAAHDFPGLLMGEVMYLPGGATAPGDGASPTLRPSR